MNKSIEKNKLIEKLKTMDEVILFLIITFGFIFVLTLISWFETMNGMKISIGNVQMYTPAMAVILVAKIKNKVSEYPKRMFNLYLTFGFVIILSYIINLFFDFGVNGIVSILTLVFSLAFIPIVLTENKEKMSKWKLRGTNVKNILLCALLYIFLLQIAGIGSYVVAGKFEELKKYLSTLNFSDFLCMIGNGIVAMTGYVMMFGEEYGWRGFLQPRLQNKFGKRIGVILLGVIWGLWHVNMYFFVVKPEYLLYSTVKQVIACVYMAIVFAYVYEKSRSIWGVVLLHALNNGMAFYMLDQYSDSLEDKIAIMYQGEFKLLIPMLVVYIIISIPFLFTKMFRKNSAKL